MNRNLENRSLSIGKGYREAKNERENIVRVRGRRWILKKDALAKY